MTEREHLKAAARQGDRLAVAELEGPRCPDEMQHLVRHAWRLHGRSGLGFGAMSLLSPVVIEAYASGTDTDFEPQEFEALMELDAAIMNPDGKDWVEDEEDEGDEPRVHRPVVPKWGRRTKPAQET